MSIGGIPARGSGPSNLPLELSTRVYPEGVSSIVGTLKSAAYSGLRVSRWPLKNTGLGDSWYGFEYGRNFLDWGLRWSCFFPPLQQQQDTIARGLIPFFLA